MVLGQSFLIACPIVIDFHSANAETFVIVRGDGGPVARPQQCLPARRLGHGVVEPQQLPRQFGDAGQQPVDRGVGVGGRVQQQIAAGRPGIAGKSARRQQPPHSAGNQRQCGDPLPAVGDDQRMEVAGRLELLDPLRQQFGADGGQLHVARPPKIVPSRRRRAQIVSGGKVDATQITQEQELLRSKVRLLKTGDKLFRNQRVGVGTNTLGWRLYCHPLFPTMGRQYNCRSNRAHLEPSLPRSHNSHQGEVVCR